MAALKFLERDGYLTLSENIFIQSRLMFAVGHEDVYRFQIENVAFDPIVKTIQRSYGGAFDGYIKIKESDLSNRLKISYNDVIAYLKKLQEYNIISYLPQTDQPQLQFITPRMDMLHLDVDAKFILLRKEIQRKQIEAVLAYAESDCCRSVQLLAYFGETNADKCGVCDVCLAEKKHEELAEYTDKIDFEISMVLQSGHFDLDDLVKSVQTGTDSDKIDRIRELLDAGKIKTDGKKYYL
ncbi:RecQ family zinc-binding domain-containing protein [Pedobacter sp.]